MALIEQNMFLKSYITCVIFCIASELILQFIESIYWLTIYNNKDQITIDQSRLNWCAMVPISANSQTRQSNSVYVNKTILQAIFACLSS